AEEAKNPGRDLAIGIVGSMVVCVAIYMIVAVSAVGALSFTRIGDSPEPLALILREIGSPRVATFLAASAVIALPTVILAFLYGQSRIFFVMARDRLLPEGLARVSRRGVPVRITVFTALVVMLFAGFLPIDAIAALANAGTLTAFTAVAVCMLVMRRRAPEMKRPFRAPAVWLVGLGAIGGCLYLFASLPSRTQLWFLGWNVLGLAVYLLYARRRADPAR
ncbi:MAG: amino acid permease, partial [Sphingomonas sp.]